MNSRERIMAAVRFEEPDRVPIDLGGLKASGISSSSYARVKQRFALETPTRIMDARFMIAAVEEEVLRRLHADVLPIDMTVIPAFTQPEDAWVPKTLFDGTKVQFMPGTGISEDAEGNWTLLHPDGTPSAYRMPHNGYYFDDLSFDCGTGIDPNKFTPVDDIPDAQLALLAHYTKRKYEETDFALLGWGVWCVLPGFKPYHRSQQ